MSAMNKTGLRLGWILALLEQSDDINHPPLSQEQRRHIERMRAQFLDVSSGAEGQRSSNNIPRSTCPVDTPFLSGNEDFFLGVFLNQHKDPVCLDLAVHMNRCYACFEIFCQVLRDYYNQREKLRGVDKGKNYG